MLTMTAVKRAKIRTQHLPNKNVITLLENRNVLDTDAEVKILSSTFGPSRLSELNHLFGRYRLTSVTGELLSWPNVFRGFLFFVAR
jgi:hypothetical protein